MLWTNYDEVPPLHYLTRLIASWHVMRTIGADVC
jgi:hypothetical protein